MSKLYVRIESDARRTELTSRGHKYIGVELLHNFTGKQEVDGKVHISVEHKGNYVRYSFSYMDYILSKMGSICSVKIFDDGRVILEE